MPGQITRSWANSGIYGAAIVYLWNPAARVVPCESCIVNCYDLAICMAVMNQRN